MINIEPAATKGPSELISQKIKRLVRLRQEQIHSARSTDLDEELGPSSETSDCQALPEASASQGDNQVQIVAMQNRMLRQRISFLESELSESRKVAADYQQLKIKYSSLIEANSIPKQQQIPSAQEKQPARLKFRYQKYLDRVGSKF